jgi:DNA-directed RNA polymerase specialized sigma subunit
MKAENKSEKLVVRLTPYQDFMIKEITKKYNVSKSSLVRFILDEFLNKLEENEQ